MFHVKHPLLFYFYNKSKYQIAHNNQNKAGKFAGFKE